MALSLVLPIASDTALARRPPGWQLLDYAQEGCVNIASPYSDRTTILWDLVNGTWTHSMNAGVRNAPAGNTSWGSYLPIAPGSSDGTYSLAYVAVQVAPGTPEGSYTLNLWADDSTRRQFVLVTLVVADTCGY